MSEPTEQPPLTQTFEERAELVLAFMYRGIHHAPEIKKEPAPYPRWSLNHRGDLSTFDFDELTRLVIAAHHFCVRASIQHSGPRTIKIVLHPRKGRTGAMFERHPTLVEAIEQSGITAEHIEV